MSISIRILFFLTAILSFRVSNIYAQRVPIEYLIKEPQTYIEKYKADESMSHIMLIMNFNKDSILNASEIKKINQKQIVRIDLVYTGYRLNKDFEQPQLNSSRLKKLMMLAPGLFENTSYKWNFFVQRGCNSPETCSDFFHGYVIYYIETPDKYSVSKENRYIDSIFQKVPVNTIKKGEKAIVKKEDSTIISPSETIRSIRCHTYYLAVSKRKREKGITFNKKGAIWWRKSERKCDTIYMATRLTKPPTTTEVSFYGDYNFHDSTVLAVLNRNKDWNDMLIVTDATGSMSPYYAQVIAWLSLQDNINKAKQLFFFNDGDMKLDSKKKIGETGGIYSTDGNSLDDVLSTLKKTVKAGFGGDCPENNLEAVIAAFNNCSTCKEVVLIVDNFANMRDYSLISKINKPVKVIICGSINMGRYEVGINVEYLDLARKTGGSVHTIENDLLDLFKLNEGQTIRIGKQKFLVKDDKFILTR